MKSRKTNEGWLLVLKKGELIVESLQNFCKQQNVGGGFVTGLGAVTAAELGFYDLEAKQYHWQKFNQAFEIVSLQGTIAKPTAHIHIALSDDSYQVRGGHLKEATVGGTCELYVEVIEGQLERQPDSETGLNLIDL